MPEDPQRNENWTQRLAAARALDRKVTDDDPAMAHAAVAEWDALLTESQPAITAELNAMIFDGAAGSHLRRYWMTDNPTDLDTAVRLYHRGLDISDPDSALARVVSNNLGRALESRYDVTDLAADLDEAIECYQRADQALALALALRKRSHRNGADLDHAVELLNELSAADSDDQTIRTTLANTVLDRFEQRHQIEDLDRATSLFDQVLRYPDLPAGPAALTRSNLAGALIHRWQHRSRLDDLHRAVGLYAQALSSSELTARQRLGVTNNYAAALDDRFHATGVLTDLDQAVEFYTDVVAGTEDTDPERPGRLSNLAVALRTRHLRRRGPDSADDLRRAIELHQEGLALPGLLRDQAAALHNNLGGALRTRYDAEADGDDLRSAIGHFEQAVALAGAGDRAGYLNNLGAALAQQGVEHDDRNALERAVAVGEEAVAATSGEAIERARYQLNLANALSELADQADSPRALEQRRATELYRDSSRRALTIAPEDAIAAASNWAEWSGARHQWEDVAEAGEIGGEAVSALVSAQTLREHKESWLRDAQGLATRRTVALARLGRLDEAATAAESGRALLLSEALATGPQRIAQLINTGRADLADRFRQATENAAAAHHHTLGHGPDSRTSGLDGGLTRVRNARRELDAVVEEIHTVPGFRTFLAAAQFEDVSTAATEQPLVYVVPADEGGVALVVRGPDVTVVDLPDLTSAAVREQAGRFRAAAGLRTARDHDLGFRDDLADLAERYDVEDGDDDRIGARVWAAALEDLTGWLGRAVMGAIVAEVLPASRATLVAGGLLGLMPLPAAWTEDPNTPTGRRHALDDPILSYAPNARALTAGRAQATNRGDRFVAVTDPSPHPLPYARLESATVAAGFGDARVLPRAQSTPPQVLAALRRADVALFSGHAEADLASPLESGLRLAPGSDDDGVLRLRHLLTENLDLRLAVLSACETSLPGTELPDEVVALPTGLLQAGVGGVIASLWPVPDRATCRLTVEFFRRWRCLNEPAATALRGAQRWMRDTTAAQKITHYEAALGAEERWLPEPTGEVFLEDLSLEEPGSRPDRALNTWAAFTHIGI